MSNPTELPDLDPCPFCGERDVEPRGPFHLLWGMHCNGCNVKTQGFVSKEDAIAAWNRRAQPEGEAPQAEQAWEKLTDATFMDFGRLVDVLLSNGVYEYGRQVNQVDWTQVRDWRYAAPAAQHAESGVPVALNGYIYHNRAEALAAQSQGAPALPTARAGDPDVDAAQWAEVFYRNAETFTVRDLGIVRAAWKEATRRAAQLDGGQGEGKAHA